jgi:F-type H+-transporting ATPase subunit delta
MARRTASARRYAEAAFELAQRERALEAWRDDLDLAAALIGDERVARFLDNPARSLAERSALVDELLGSRVARGVRNLVMLLAQRGRIELLPAVVREFTRLYNEQAGVATAVVTSAAPLTDDEVAAVRSRVEAMTGAKVELELVVDEKLIGGISVRVGDQLIDASVRGRLERLREQLLAGAR